MMQKVLSGLTGKIDWTISFIEYNDWAATTARSGFNDCTFQPG